MSMGNRRPAEEDGRQQEEDICLDDAKEHFKNVQDGRHTNCHQNIVRCVICCDSEW